MAKKVFYFLYNKRNNNLRVRFAQRPTTPQTTEYKLKVTIDGTLFPPAPASVTPDASGNCVFDLNIAGEEPGVWDVVAIPVRNGQPVTNDSIFGNFNTTNPFLRKWAFVTYVVLALLLIGFGAYKWVNRDTANVKKISRIEIPPNGGVSGGGQENYPPNRSAAGATSMGGTFAKAETDRVVIPVYIPAHTQYTAITLTDNNPGGNTVTDGVMGANPKTTPTRTGNSSTELRQVRPGNASGQQAEGITLHTKEVDGVSLAPGASYTQSIPPLKAFKPVTENSSAVRITHTGGQRIDGFGTTTADTVTIKNISNVPVYVQFQWFDVIDNEPAEK